ncbi:MAG: DUF502 domain-containing protein [Chlamydiota bacterium]
MDARPLPQSLLALTVGIIYRLFPFPEHLAGPPIKMLIGKYIPGMGIVTAVIVRFFIGYILNRWIISKTTHFFDRIFKKIPFFQSLDKVLKNVTHFFQASPDREKNKVVVSLDRRANPNGLYHSRRFLRLCLNGCEC